MGTYRLFPATDGPASPVNYGATFLAGVVFEVTAGGCWFEGYWWWVCPDSGGSDGFQPTAPQKFALWGLTGAGTGDLVPGSVVTSGALTAGQWNYVPLASPLPLSLGVAYTAATGFTGPFPDTSDQFGSGQPYAAGITSGPLFAYSDQGGSVPVPYGMAQGAFGTASADPSVNMPGQGSNSANFWMDLQVSDTAPEDYAGSYRLWPNNAAGDQATAPDSAVNYVVGTEIHLSEDCTLDALWYLSPPGAGQLATSCGVWDIGTRQQVSGTDSPAWSGAAGSGWVSCPFTGVTLPAGQYRIAVYNGAAVPDQWSAKRLSYWGAGGPGAAGITSGPLSAPPTASAAPASIYQGTGTEPGQSVFAVGPPDQYPDLYVDGLFQNYWVDAEVTPAVSIAGAAALSGQGSASVGAEIARLAGASSAGTGQATAGGTVTSPGGIMVIEVTGEHVEDLSGGALGGVVIFSTSVGPLSYPAVDTFFDGSAVAEVTGGVMSPVTIPTTDSLSPGFTYTITLRLQGPDGPGDSQVFAGIAIPSTLGSTVDLSALLA